MPRSNTSPFGEIKVPSSHIRCRNSMKGSWGLRRLLLLGQGSDFVLGLPRSFFHERFPPDAIVDDVDLVDVIF